MFHNQNAGQNYKIKVLTDGYVMCLVYKIAVIAVMGYVWEEFGVLFIFVSCARLVMTNLGEAGNK